MSGTNRLFAFALPFLVALACLVAVPDTAAASSCASLHAGKNHFSRVAANGVGCTRAHNVLKALAALGQGTRLGFFCQEAGTKTKLSVVCMKGGALISALDIKA